LKVPLIFYMPSKVKKNAYDMSNIVCGLDIMATICDFAGIQAPANCRGESLWPIVKGKCKIKKKNFSISELKQTNRIVRQGDLKYIKFYRYSGNREEPFVRKSDGGFEKFQPGNSSRYVESDIKMLFDLKKDPWETRNLANEPGYAQAISQMEALLQNEFENVVIPGTSYIRK